MHFHGQMSTHPSQRMHSAWSMWRNCFGFTDCVSHFGSTSCSTYEVENSRIAGLASFLAMTTRSLVRRHWTAVCGCSLRTAESGEPAAAGDRRRLGRGFLRRRLGDLALLPRREERDVEDEYDDIDQRGHPVDEL